MDHGFYSHIFGEVLPSIYNQLTCDEHGSRINFQWHFWALFQFSRDFQLASKGANKGPTFIDLHPDPVVVLFPSGFLLKKYQDNFKLLCQIIKRDSF
jgi:hypothetical protein